MRMKDSDDYITARAANPRTGMISPSVPSTTPRVHTPETPGEALELRLDLIDGAQQVQSSLSPSLAAQSRARPALRRANQGRKVSPSGNVQDDPWKLEDHTASPDMRLNVPRANRGGGLGAYEALKQAGQNHMDESEDRFVLPMPSAREPQPYAFPGYSSRQIEAYEHYKAKSRQTSAEGYDTRIITTDVGGTRYVSNGSEYTIAGEEDERQTTTIGAQAMKNEHVACHLHRNLTVIRSETRVRDAGSDDCDGKEHKAHTKLQPSGFAHVSSLRSANADSDMASTIQTGQLLAAVVGREPVRRRPVDANATRLRHALHNDGRRLQPPTHLSPSIPRTRPNSADPHKLNTRGGGHGAARQCSLGCLQDANLQVCLDARMRALSADAAVAMSGSAKDGNIFTHHDGENMDARRAATGVTKVRRKRVVSVETNASARPRTSSELVVEAVIACIAFCRTVQLPSLPSLPRLAVLETIKAEDATAAEKAEAVRTILSSVGQAVALMTILAVAWQLGSMVWNLVTVLCWPLTVPLRILRWMLGS